MNQEQGKSYIILLITKDTDQELTKDKTKAKARKYRKTNMTSMAFGMKAIQQSLWSAVGVGGRTHTNLVTVALTRKWSHVAAVRTSKYTAKAATCWRTSSKQFNTCLLSPSSSDTSLPILGTSHYSTLSHSPLSQKLSHNNFIFIHPDSSIIFETSPSSSSFSTVATSSSPTLPTSTSTGSSSPSASPSHLSSESTTPSSFASAARSSSESSAISASSSSAPSTPKSITSSSLYAQLRLLFKLELSLAVTTTSIVGYILAGGSLFSFPTVGLAMLVGTFCHAITASMGNQLKEVEFDRQMPRTATRPLPKGTMQPYEVKLLAMATNFLGIGILYYASNSMVAPLLGVLTSVSYVYLYTPMKRTSVWNTAVGAIVGAMPILIGAACVNPNFLFQLDQPATQAVLIAYALMTFWQIPHFAVIELQYESQYAAAGYRMFASKVARNWCIATFFALAALPIISSYYGLTSEWFYLTGTAVHIYLGKSLFGWWKEYETTGKSSKCHRHVLYRYFTMMCVLLCCHSLTSDFLGLKAYFADQPRSAAIESSEQSPK